MAKPPVIPHCPKGAVYGRSPGGSAIAVRPPRGPGPWWRVKHVAFGGEMVKATSREEACRQFFQKYMPSILNDKAMLAAESKLCRAFPVEETPTPPPADPGPEMASSHVVS
jgi:hypothetical protein